MKKKYLISRCGRIDDDDDGGEQNEGGREDLIESKGVARIGAREKWMYK